MKLKMLMFVFLGILLTSSTAYGVDYDVSITITPKVLNVNPYGIATVDVLIENTGELADTYEIRIEGVPAEWDALSQEFVGLEPGESKTVYLFMTPVYFKRESFTTTVSAVGQSTASDSFVMNIIPDHELRVTIPKDITSCLCEEDETLIIVENLGLDFSEDVTLSISGDAVDIVEIELVGFTLEPGEVEEIPVRINETCELEEKTYELKVEVKSSTSYAFDSVESLINKVKCFDFEAYYPEEIRTCAGVEKTFEIEIKNTGLKEDSYEIVMGDFSDLVTLEPNESKVFNVSIMEEEVGIYNVTFTVISSSIEKEGIVILNVERCYGVDLEVDETELTITSGTGSLTKPRVTNVGTKSDVFNILSDVGWVAIKPSTVSLEPNEMKEVYVYYSPEYGAEGTFEAELTAESEHSKDGEIITIYVVMEAVPEVTTVPEGMTTVPENVTYPPEVPEPEITEPTTVEPEIKIPEGIIPKLIQNKILLSLLVGFVVALIIIGLIYFFVMGGG